MEHEPSDDPQSGKDTSEDENKKRKRLLAEAAQKLALEIGGSILNNNPGLEEEQ